MRAMVTAVVYSGAAFHSASCERWNTRADGDLHARDVYLLVCAKKKNQPDKNYTNLGYVIR